jgi:hypothetical protein
MLDFCEALGRMLSDDAWRAQIFAFQQVDAETDCHIVFPRTSFIAVRALLTGVLQFRSHSLATDGEVLRIAAKKVATNLVDSLAANLRSRNLQFNGRSGEFYAALGALTIDQVLRNQFIADPSAGIREIPGLNAADLTDLTRVIGDANYVNEADSLCRRVWSEGCFVRIRHYPAYEHPNPRIKD